MDKMGRCCWPISFSMPNEQFSNYILRIQNNLASKYITLMLAYSRCARDCNATKPEVCVIDRFGYKFITSRLPDFNFDAITAYQPPRLHVSYSSRTTSTGDKLKKANVTSYYIKLHHNVTVLIHGLPEILCLYNLPLTVW